MSFEHLELSSIVFAYVTLFNFFYFLYHRKVLMTQHSDSDDINEDVSALGYSIVVSEGLLLVGILFANVGGVFVYFILSLSIIMLVLQFRRVQIVKEFSIYFWKCYAFYLSASLFFVLEHPQIKISANRILISIGIIFMVGISAYGVVDSLKEHFREKEGKWND